MKRRFYRREDGLLSLEACISLTVFIFLMLFLYSLFIVFEAQNEVAHVLLATADSMSLDTYSNQKLLGANSITSAIAMVIYGVEDATGLDSNYVSHEMWNQVLKDEATNIWDGSIYASDLYAAENGAKDAENNPRYAVSSNLEPVIRERFLAYLSGGNRDSANKLLTEHYHIVNGVEGLNFSKSYISSGILHLIVDYKIEYEFSVFGIGTLELEQRCASKMWQP